jgi:prepilin-type N-terminal cleavage/methylation domain-containing protein
MRWKATAESDTIHPMKPAHKRGFTLIELLVVVAIIGLIAAIVLAGVGLVRNKGIDTYARGQLSQLRSAAELFRQNNSNSYIGFCASATADAAIKNLATNVPSAGAGNYVENTNGSMTGVVAGKVNCVDDVSAFVIDSPLSAGTGSRWCVDSLGRSLAEAAVPSATACN